MAGHILGIHRLQFLRGLCTIMGLSPRRAGPKEGAKYAKIKEEQQIKAQVERRKD